MLTIKIHTTTRVKEEKMSPTVPFHVGVLRHVSCQASSSTLIIKVLFLSFNVNANTLDILTYALLKHVIFFFFLIRKLPPFPILCMPLCWE